MTQVAGRREVEPAASSPLRRLGVVPGLDGVRGLAVLLVLLVHVQLLLPFQQTGVGWIDGFFRGGYLGVDLFFVLSGFLITALLLEEIGRTDWLRFGSFYVRRALRLLPALYVLLAASVVYAVLEDLPSENQYRTVRAAVLYISNWQVVVEPTSVAHELTHLWSLAIEEQFYLWWPVVLVTFLGLRRSARFVGIVLGTVIVGVVVWRWYLLDQGVDWTELTVRTDTRVDALLIGALLASLWVRRATPSGRWLDGAAWVALGVLVFSAGTFEGPDDLGYQGGLTVFAGAAAVVVLAVVNGTWSGRRFFELAPLRALGKVSYGLYLWHYPVFYVVSIHGETLADGRRVLLGLALAALATLLSWFLVERPALALKRRFGAHNAPPTATARVRRTLPPEERRQWLGAAAVAVVGVLALWSWTGPASGGGVAADGSRQPEGLPFPTGDVDRTRYWGLVDLVPSVIDDFERDDRDDGLGDAPTGQEWATVAGAWGVTDGAAVLSGPPDPGQPALAVLSHGVRDGLTEVTLPTVAEGAGLLIRYRDDANHWTVTAEPDQGVWRVQRTEGGTVTEVGTFEAPTEDDVTISVTQNAETLRFLVDGAEYLTVFDPPLSGPFGAGLAGIDATSAEARWDRFMVMAFRGGEAGGG